MSRVGVESVYPTRFGPPVSIFRLHETLVLRVPDQIRQQERLLMVELVRVDCVAGDDDVGPVGATHNVMAVVAVVLLKRTNERTSLLISSNLF